jgi:hypothetical protein
VRRFTVTEEVIKTLNSMESNLFDSGKATFKEGTYTLLESN